MGFPYIFPIFLGKGLENMANGIKTRLQTITDMAHVFSANELPNVVNDFPCALILPSTIEYNKSFTNKNDVNFRILILMSKQDNPSALNRLLDYIDPSGSDSVYAAIDADTTLGGAADDSMVVRCSGVGSTVWGGYTYLSTEFEIMVYG